MEYFTDQNVECLNKCSNLKGLSRQFVADKWGMVEQAWHWRGVAGDL